MSASATIKDGVIQNLGNSVETEAAKKKTGQDSVDKEQFLNLLVTELKYQDPLQPMDNTEYVAQLATFSELEQMQNVAKSTEVSRATSMVGSLVTVESTNETTGKTTEITGKVDYVSVNGNNVKVSVNDQLYELSAVKQVYDANYADAVALAEEWGTAYGQLPSVNNITAANAGTYTDRLKYLYNTYNEMSTYQKTFLSADLQSGLQAYVELFKSYGIDVTGSSQNSSNNSNNSNSSDNTSNSNSSVNTGSQTTTTT